jgi:glucosylceramidase
MASCDFSTHPYSYDDQSGDFMLQKFALADEDTKYKVKNVLSKSRFKLNVKKILKYQS